MAISRPNADVVKLVDTLVLEASTVRCVGSSPTVRTTSKSPESRWEIVIPDVFRDPPERLKEWLVGYISTFKKKPALADRIEEDRLTEQDLFFLNQFFPKMYAFHGVKPSFRRTAV